MARPRRATTTMPMIWNVAIRYSISTTKIQKAYSMCFILRQNRFILRKKHFILRQLTQNKIVGFQRFNGLNAVPSLKNPLVCANILTAKRP